MEPQRITGIDVLRGLVMIIMALDHTRDFFHFDATLHDPLDLSTTSPALFFTRWITHYCAPVFVFLSGTSIYLQGLRKTKSELSLFLLKRGLWLIITEIFIVSFSWTYDIFFNAVFFQVIWAIGMSMIVMSLIIRLHFKVILATGIVIVAGHNILDYIPQTHNGLFWDLVRNGGFKFYPITNYINLVIIYPFLPWTGAMILGYCLGKIYQNNFSSEKRKTILINGGIAAICAFVIIRLLNHYGDPHPWEHQNSGFFTFLSFIDVNKYPPSLLFLLMTLGPALILLSLFENVKTKATSIIEIYGKVPFFYYVLHFYIIHTLCMFMYLMNGHTFAEPDVAAYGIVFKYQVPGEGLSLTATYGVWIFVVAVLYYPCKWFSKLKQKNKSWWLSYL